MSKNTTLFLAIVVVAFLGGFIYFQTLNTREDLIKDVNIVQRSDGKQEIAYEVINGVAVPPEPDPELNNATLAGIDVNGNGVRDDVERVIARTKYETSEKREAIFKYATSQQRMLVEGSDEAILANSRDFQCGNLTSKETNPITFAWANTDERVARYREVLVGAPSRKPDCEGWEDEILMSESVTSY